MHVTCAYIYTRTPFSVLDPNQAVWQQRTFASHARQLLANRTTGAAGVWKEAAPFNLRSQGSGTKCRGTIKALRSLLSATSGILQGLWELAVRRCAQTNRVGFSGPSSRLSCVSAVLESDAKLDTSVIMPCIVATNLAVLHS